jgi:ribonuclease HII
MLYHENRAKLDGYKYIAGVDEVGRGPLAGPVVACAVFLKNKRFKAKIADSKKLSAQQRQVAFEEIVRKSVFGLGWVGKSGIDSINILEATKLAMEKAIDQLFIRLCREKKTPKKNLQKQTCFLIDGNFFHKKTGYGVRNIIAGDSKSLSIAAASIVAKVSRDRLMEICDRFFPQYGFARHKGYGTKEHMAALNKFGPSAIHRRSFYPVKNDYAD